MSNDYWLVIQDQEWAEDHEECKHRRVASISRSDGDVSYACWHEDRESHYGTACVKGNCPIIFDAEDDGQPLGWRKSQELRELLRELLRDYSFDGENEIVHPGNCSAMLLGSLLRREELCTCGLAEKMQRVRELIMAGDQPQSFTE